MFIFGLIAGLMIGCGIGWFACAIFRVGGRKQSCTVDAVLHGQRASVISVSPQRSLN